MWRPLVAALLLTLSASSVSAQQWATKMFETTEHDFGTVARGAKIEYRFKFTNSYKEDVHVASVRTSCNCTTPTVTKDLLKTWETGEIVAAFNTASFLGQRSATLTVTIDQPFFAEVQLHIKGYIRSDIVVTPGEIDFGTVDVGQPAEQKLSITYAGRGDWKLMGVKVANPMLEVELTEKSRMAGQVSYELFARLKKEAPAGYVKEELILMTNDVKAPEFPICVEGLVASELSISPSPLALGNLEPGQKIEKKFVVKGKKPFRITDIICADERFEFEITDAAKPMHLVKVFFTAPLEPGKVTSAIKILTDLNDNAASELTAHAQVIPATASKTRP